MKHLILLLTLVLACSAQQRAETVRAASVFACEVAVLTPFVPDAMDAEELVEGIVVGQVSLPVALGRLGVLPEQASRVIDEFNACFAGNVLQPLPTEFGPEGMTSLRAPPPAYGNKIL